MISIVMSYYNRKPQFIKTMDSICLSKQKDIEVIVIDDCSVAGHRLEDLQKVYPFMKLTRLEEKDKWYICNCIPNNMGIAQAKGEIIVLQNPECYHVGDVLSYIVENITNNNLLSISTYAYGVKYNLESIEKTFDTQPQKRYKKGLGWYNHPKYRPVFFHFCTALMKTTLDKLGGFDERYADGIAYDDDEFVLRAKRLGLEMKIPTKVSVIHQYHSKVSHFREDRYAAKIKRNRTIFNLLTAKEDAVHVNNRYRKPKVTVIIPYKVDRGWLKEAIESVPSWVQLLVSQGEGDWASNFNKAYPQATGDYIKFLHEDDMLVENGLEEAVQALEEQGADFIHGRAYTINEDGKIIGAFKPQKVEITYTDLQSHNYIHGGSLLFHRRIFDKLKGFDESINHSEEYEFTLRCLQAGFKLGYCSSFLYSYRQHRGQKTKKYTASVMNKMADDLVKDHKKKYE